MPDYPFVTRIVITLISLSVGSVLLAVFIDFIMFDSKQEIKRSKQSIVATGSMLGFFALYYSVIALKLGCVRSGGLLLVAIGTAMIVTGAVINILGRLQLKGNWANHIKIYHEHILVDEGVYCLVRHPLYASLMLMLFGGSTVYRNWMSAVMTAFIFVPFMYYRAKQEEVLLREEFSEYKDYARNTGMFFPKLRKKGL